MNQERHFCRQAEDSQSRPKAFQIIASHEWEVILTSVSEQGPRDVHFLTAADGDGLPLEQLLGADSGETAHKVTLCVDDNALKAEKEKLHACTVGSRPTPLKSSFSAGAHVLLKRAGVSNLTRA